MFRIFQNSLRLKLILPYVLLILLLTAAIGWLSWWAGSRTVNNLSENLTAELTERIAQAVDRHMFGTSAVLETAFPTDMQASNDISTELKGMIMRFYTAASLYTNPSDYVYYGNEQGQGLGLQKLVDGTAQIRLKTKADAHRDFYLLYGINGKPEYRFTESTVFNPRDRLWYKLGRDALNHTWTAVYLDYGTQELVVTRARKVMNEQGEFSGVVATDVFLSELSRFIRHLGISANSRAFIVEPSGQLIAASSVANIRATADGGIERVSANNSADALIELAWQALQPMLQDLSNKQDGKVHQLSITDQAGEVIHLSVKNVQDNAGLNWYAVIAVPSRDILTDVRGNVSLVVFAGLLAMLLAVMVGLFIFGRIAHDVAQLSLAVKNTGHDMQDVSKQTQRNDELGVLARSFNQMRTELLTDALTGVANRSALDYMLGNLVRERKVTQQPFAVLFIDLNKFKPLNDQYGHDKGDLALIEVAQRIQGMMRGQDLLARLGGDEFVVVLSDVADQQTAAKISLRIQNAVSQPLLCCQDVAPQGESVCLGAAIGVALFPEHGQDVASLMKHADQEMYEEKERTQAGR